MTDDLHNQSCGVFVHTTPTIKNKCKRLAVGRLADGTPACKAHLKQEQATAEKRINFDEKYFEADRYKRECVRLSAALGVEILPVYEYRSGGYVTTAVQISIADLAKLCNYGCPDPDEFCEENCTKFRTEKET